jgi:feruloyl esterase
MPLAALYWDQLARFAIARDPAFDPTTLDPENPGRFARRINRLVDMLDVRPAGLSQFRRRGGKLLVWHGLADPLVSHRATEAYWAALEAAMGKKAVASFALFFVAPGFGHGGGVFVPVWDPLTALEAWAENGVAPDGLTVSDGAGRTRPLCEHGTWPRYLGHGDPNRAASFTCQSSSAG